MAISGKAARKPEAPPPPLSPRPNPSPAGDAPGVPPPRRRRLRRWLTLVAGSLALLVLLACSSVWWLGRHLDHPWVKPRLVGFMRDSLGLDIDYEGLELSLLEGIRARSLVLLTPASLAAGAPELARIEGLALDARLWAFALGARSIDALRVERVQVALVRDASGRSSLGELFPSEPDPPGGDEPVRPSQLLNELPRLSIEHVELTAIGLDFVELSDDGSRRVTSLTGPALSGTLESGAEGLAGTALELSAAPLTLEQTRGARPPVRATLRLQLELRASEAQAFALSVAASDLEASGIDPRLVSWPGPLLMLTASLRTEPEAGRALLAIDRASALGGRLALDTRSELTDTSGLAVVTSGRARVDLDTLPIPIPGVSLESLRLDVSTDELAWDGVRVSGAIDYGGQLASVQLDSDAGGARLADLTLAGQGSFSARGGRFESTLKAATLVARSLASSVEASDVRLEVRATTRELAGAQQLEASAALALGAARAAAPGQRIELDGVRAEAALGATTRELRDRVVPRLDASASIQRAFASVGAQRLSSNELALNVHGQSLARDGRAPFGVRGDASVRLSIPTLELREGRGAPERALSIARIEAKAELPLSLERASGTLTIAALGGSALRLQGLALDLDADAPLAWGDGGARAHAHGRAATLEAGAASASTLVETRRGLRVSPTIRGAELELDLRLAEPERLRYRLELDARGASLTLGGAKLAGPLTATLRADARAAGMLKLTSELRGARGGSVDLGLDAQFERESERLRYEATLSADQLAAFAELVTAAAPAARHARLDRARLTASARGDLTGLLRAGEGSLPELAERPLASARGSQSAKLALEGFDYRGEGGALAIPSLALELESTHRAEAGGTASARLRLPELSFEGGGRSLRLGGVDQAIVASFERAPDRGVVDVDTALSVASATQSWLPSFPVRGLRLSSNLQIDRLRSIFLRELALDNPASGSGLRAAGTLELLAQSGAGGDKTIVGREALSFEGRLTQRLAALEPLELASHARGAIELPFRLESGGLLGYRLIAALEAKQVSFTAQDGSFAVEELNGVVPVVEEFALLDSGPVISAGPRTSPLSDTRFFDVHAFLAASDYVTARSIRIGGLAPFGPIAANVRIDRSDFIIDQLQAGYQGGQIVGQVRAAWRDGDPIVRLRLNATGVQSGKSRDVFDANTALTFVPAAMTLDGKMQIVRASREHVDDILDVLDPFHESANANRVRSGLALGYPKFVRFHLHDGAVDTKVELGGLAQLVRIDEIKAVPLGPILQKYVAPALPALPRSPAERAPVPASAEVPVASTLAEGGAPPRAHRQRSRVQR